MKHSNYPEEWPDINSAYYNRSVRLFSAVQKLLSVKLELYADTQTLQGDIFLFNHFSRFETFIPQFLIYEQSGAYSCAIASGEFFKEDNVLSRYLSNVGVFPHDHNRLFPLLAAHIIRGRKVIIFPEGGMVKDRRVMDRHGRYSVFSRLTGERRKHHTGAAVLAQGLEAFKTTVRNAYCNKNYKQLLVWKESLGLDSLEQLLTGALRPTRIVPANITFYPIRSSENLLQQGVEMFSDGLSLRQTEELIIEGNILLKDTDMDVRLGKSVDPSHVWGWWNRYLLDLVAPEFNTLDDVFALHAAPKNWKQKLLGAYFKKSASATRNQYMKEIYANVTINLSHLAATLIMYCVSKGQDHISKQKFYTTLYIAVKHLQKNSKVSLHRSLYNPDDYSDLIAGTNKRFAHFIQAAVNSELLKEENDHYHFLPKLLTDSDFDSIRVENPVAVYNNEAEPISGIQKVLIKALAEFERITPKYLAQWHFEDEFQTMSWEKKRYSKPEYDDINQQEALSADPSPFLLHPKQANGKGVLLVHGLLASPAELRDYGDYLQNQGYTVLGIRLLGHGTSPHALSEQDWQDWYASVKRGFSILKAFCPHNIITGFSTGAALAFMLASEQFPEIKAVVAVAAPYKFVDKTFMLIPLLHGSNKLVGGLSTLEGVKSFIGNVPEHPAINYHNMPVKSLYELQILVDEMTGILPDVTPPTLLIHSDKDPVVAFESMQIICDKLSSENKQTKVVKADKHGILMENIDGIWATIDHFLNEIDVETVETS